MEPGNASAATPTGLKIASGPRMTRPVGGKDMRPRLRGQEADDRLQADHTAGEDHRSEYSGETRFRHELRLDNLAAPRARAVGTAIPAKVSGDDLGSVLAMNGGRRLRVVHVVASGLFAGVERSITLSAKALSQLGHEVTVIGGAEEPMHHHLDGLDVTWLPAATKLQAIRQLWRVGRVDIVHAHMTNAELAAIAAGRATERRSSLPVTSLSAGDSVDSAGSPVP